MATRPIPSVNASVNGDAAADGRCGRTLNPSYISFSTAHFTASKYFIILYHLINT